MASSKRAYAKEKLPGLLPPVPLPCSEPLPAHTPPQEMLQHQQAELVQSPGGHCSFPPGPGACETLFVTSKSRVCSPQSCGSPVIKSRWPSVRFPGDSWCLCPVPRLESLMWGSEPSRQRENLFGATVLRLPW
ncbi:unnamed protein product [Rangifer tarandus platyrhynchus]|uniref:Uncharacterized protein n=1 Tax=Rangifer tarandus platyrhynchus TaxID=3082113 RepID=A0AC59ZVW5_RANTA